VLANEKWEFLSPGMSSTDLVDAYEKYTSNLVNNIFPLKTVTVSEKDKPYFSEELKKLRRQRQRIYCISGRSPKYLNIKAQFDQKLKAEAAKYQQKIQAEVLEGKRNNAYSALRKLGVGVNDCGDNGFTLPSHAENNLSPQQSADLFADYFSSISQEFEPINIQNFPTNI
jgi:hypothetical protein